MSTWIQVLNLPYYYDELTIVNMFRDVGTIKRAEVVKNHLLLTTVGYVQFTRAKYARAAATKKDQTVVGNSAIRVYVIWHHKETLSSVKVTNLPSKITKRELVDHFSPYGEIVDIKFHKKPFAADIAFRRVDYALQACQEMDGSVLPKARDGLSVALLNPDARNLKWKRNHFEYVSCQVPSSSSFPRTPPPRRSRKNRRNNSMPARSPQPASTKAKQKHQQPPIQVQTQQHLFSMVQPFPGIPQFTPIPTAMTPQQLQASQSHVSLLSASNSSLIDGGGCQVYPYSVPNQVAFASQPVQSAQPMMQTQVFQPLLLPATNVNGIPQYLGSASVPLMGVPGLSLQQSNTSILSSPGLYAQQQLSNPNPSPDGSGKMSNSPSPVAISPILFAPQQIVNNSAPKSLIVNAAPSIAFNQLNGQYSPSNQASMNVNHNPYFATSPSVNLPSITPVTANAAQANAFVSTTPTMMFQSMPSPVTSTSSISSGKSSRHNSTTESNLTSYRSNSASTGSFSSGSGMSPYKVIVTENGQKSQAPPGVFPYVSNPRANVNARNVASQEVGKKPSITSSSKKRWSSQQQQVGDVIYNALKDIYPKRVAKITGMILTLDDDDIIPLLADQNLLKAKAKQFYQLLQSSN